MIVTDGEELPLILDIMTRFPDTVHIQCFNTTEDACRAFEAEPEAFEFVLTDLPLPGAENPQLRRRLRSFRATRNILLALGSQLLSHEEAEQKGFCAPQPRRFPLTDFQEALEPATLKYAPAGAGLARGLKPPCRAATGPAPYPDQGLWPEGDGHRELEAAEMPRADTGVDGRIGGVGKIPPAGELIGTDDMPVAGEIVMGSEVIVGAGNQLQAQGLRPRREVNRDVPIRPPSPAQVHAI